MHLRLRDFARLAQQSFLTKLMQGKDPFAYDVAHDTQPEDGREYIPGPNGEFTGVYKLRDLWEIDQNEAARRVLDIAKMTVGFSTVPEDYVSPGNGFMRGHRKSKAEYRGLLALPEDQQRETCRRWIAEAKIAVEQSNPGIAVPQLAT